MIVVSPHFAGALVTRRTDLVAGDGSPLVEYIYTHDRAASIAAARAYLDQMKPETITYRDTASVLVDNKDTEQARRASLDRDLAERLSPPRVR